MKALKIALGLMLALILTTMTVGTALAGTMVDEKIGEDLEMKSKAMGVYGTITDLSLKKEGETVDFRVKVEVTGLKPEAKVLLVKGMHTLDKGMADGNGKLTFDVELDKFGKDTLVGLKLQVQCAKTYEVLLTRIIYTDDLKD
jgi:hypothetical protein